LSADFIFVVGTLFIVKTVEDDEQSFVEGLLSPVAKLVRYEE